MKSRLLPVSALLLAALVFARPAAADPAPPEPATISTSGSAELHVPADLVDLQFTVSVRAADLAAARKKHAERATKVLAALRAAGIEEKDLQTSQLNVEPTYVENSHGETTTIKYYELTQGFTCTLHDVKKVADVTSDVMNAGATGVSEANLRTSELRKYRDQARAEAARAAREKAEAIAKELGAKVGKPFRVAEGPEYSNAPGSYNRSTTVAPAKPSAGEDSEPQAVFSPGLITVTASVSVTFYLE